MQYIQSLPSIAPDNSNWCKKNDRTYSKTLDKAENGIQIFSGQKFTDAI